MEKKSVITRVVSILIAAAMLLAVLPIGIVSVSASEQATSFAIRDTEPSYDNPYYINWEYGGYNECIEISNGFCLPNCVGYTWGRAYEAMGSRPNLCKGNAKLWWDYNIDNDIYPYGYTPAAGAIACYNESGDYGHVLFVENVIGDTVYFSESYYLSYPYYFNYGSLSIADMETYRGGFQGYIYLGITPAPTYVDLGSDFYAFIIKQDSWKHLAAENGNLQLSSTGNNSADPKQIWHFIKTSDGSYKIVNEYDGRCLDAANFGTSNGTNVGVCASNDSTAQRWFVSTKGSGYALSPAYTSMVIDIDDSLNDPGTNAQLWQPANTSAQIFSIYKLTEDGVTYSKPAKPSAVTVNASISSNKLNISWSQSPLIGRYDSRVYDVIIYKGSASGTPIHKKTGLNATSCSYTLDGEGTYYVKVASVNTKYYEWYTLSSAVKVETKTDTLGDMDGDGSISVADALSALRIAAKLARATSSIMKIADVDFDGAITVSDALAILRVAAKLAVTKPLSVTSFNDRTLYPGCYKKYSVASNYANVHKVEWSSSNASIASVDSEGKVTAVKEGTATITAKVSVIGQQKSVSFTVTVTNPSVVLSPASQSTSFDARSDNRVVISKRIAYKCPLPSVTTDVNEAYCGDSRVSASSITKEITSGDGKFSGEYFYSYQPGVIKIKYSFTLAGKTYSSTYTCNFTLTRTNPDMGQYIRSSTSTSSENLGMVPANTTYVITQVAVTGTVGESGTQVWGYTTYGGVSGWTLIEYWQ